MNFTVLFLCPRISLKKTQKKTADDYLIQEYYSHFNYENFKSNHELLLKQIKYKNKALTQYMLHSLLELSPQDLKIERAMATQKWCFENKGLEVSPSKTIHEKFVEKLNEYFGIYNDKYDNQITIYSIEMFDEKLFKYIDQLKSVLKSNRQIVLIESVYNMKLYNLKNALYAELAKFDKQQSTSKFLLKWKKPRSKSADKKLPRLNPLCSCSITPRKKTLDDSLMKHTNYYQVERENIENKYDQLIRNLQYEIFYSIKSLLHQLEEATLKCLIGDEEEKILKRHYSTETPIERKIRKKLNMKPLSIENESESIRQFSSKYKNQNSKETCV